MIREEGTRPEARESKANRKERGMRMRKEGAEREGRRERDFLGAGSRGSGSGLGVAFVLLSGLVSSSSSEDNRLSISTLLFSVTGW